MTRQLRVTDPRGFWSLVKKVSVSQVRRIGGKDSRHLCIFASMFFGKAVKSEAPRQTPADIFRESNDFGRSLDLFQILLDRFHVCNDRVIAARAGGLRTDNIRNLNLTCSIRRADDGLVSAWFRRAPGIAPDHP